VVSELVTSGLGSRNPSRAADDATRRGLLVSRLGAAPQQ
jgi:hypothetical protein